MTIFIDPSNQLQMEFKIPAESVADIKHLLQRPGRAEFRPFDFAMDRVEAKRKKNTFQILPKLENISYSPRGNSNNLRQQHRRRHTSIQHEGQHHGRKIHHAVHQSYRSKSRNRQHQRKHRLHHNPRYDPELLKDIANDEPLSTGKYK